MGAQGTCPQLSTIAHTCCHFATKVPFSKGPKSHRSAQLQMIVHKLQRVALRLESPHLNAVKKRPELVTCENFLNLFLTRLALHKDLRNLS